MSKPVRDIFIPTTTNRVGNPSNFFFLYSCLAFQEVSQLSGLPEYVKIVEVGPRDGLQNEKVGLYYLYIVNSLKL